MLASFIDFWNRHSVALILFILGIPIAIYIARQFARSPKPCFCYFTQHRITKSKNEPDEIEIFYKKKPVTRVSSTIVWFWNAGKGPIRSVDIPANHPLRIVFVGEELEILDVSVWAKTREAVNVQPEKVNATTIELRGINFLDWKDGYVLEIQHTGTPSVTAQMTGVILGAPSGIKARLKRTLDTPSSKSFRLWYSLFIATIFVLMSWGMITDLSKEKELLKRSEVKESLQQNLQPEVASQAIDALSKIGKPSEFVLYGGLSIMGILCALMIFFLVWYRDFSIPSSLLVTEDRRPSKNAKSPTPLLPATADGINISPSDVPSGNENANSRIPITNSR